MPQIGENEDPVARPEAPLAARFVLIVPLAAGDHDQREAAEVAKARHLATGADHFPDLHQAAER